MSWVVLAEPWFAGSHRAWAEGWAAASRHEVSVVGLPPAGWRWRLRAGAHPLADAIGELVGRRGRWPDAVVVSGLVDVSSLLGHLRMPPDVAVVTYMHESQLVYPTADRTIDEDSVLRNWSSWLVSDSVWFNSSFHRAAVIDALPGWAARQPEPIDLATVDAVTSRFDVVPVGVTRPPGRQVPGEPAEPLILWPHRWEWDKRPDVFVRAVDKLSAAGVDAGLVLAGEDPGDDPVRADLLRRHRDRIVAVGPFERSDYERWLTRSDIVVSCAEHEFFGVAVVEAMMAGCVPLLPAALSYPEIVPSDFHAVALYPPGTFGSALVDAVRRHEERCSETVDLSAALSIHEWSVVAPVHDSGIDGVMASGGVAQR